MITLRQLTTADASLISEALSWIDHAPRWFRDCDAVWGHETAEDYLKKMGQQADWAVMEDNQLHSVISLTVAGKGIYNVHLMTRRNADITPLVIAGQSIRQQLFAKGIREIWCWLAVMNRGAQRAAELIGFIRDGVQMFKGQTHGKVILWERFSCRSSA